MINKNGLSVTRDTLSVITTIVTLMLGVGVFFLSRAKHIGYYMVISYTLISFVILIYSMWLGYRKNKINWFFRLGLVLIYISITLILFPRTSRYFVLFTFALTIIGLKIGEIIGRGKSKIIS